MKKIYIALATLVMLTMTSCGDFLKEYSQDLTYAKTAADLDEVLMGNGYMKIADVSQAVATLGSKTGYYFPWLHIMDDDATINYKYEEAKRTSFMQFYLWGTYPYMKDNEIIKDDSWIRLYEHISVVNAVLSKTDDVKSQPEEIERIKGECHFLRASFYYLLVNIYAKPYSKATAAQELGVPIKTTEYIEDKYFTRNTVAAVYDQIINDLNEASRLLKGKVSKSVYRANYYAAQALLSRVYLYTEEYEKAVSAADQVLGAKYAVLDFRGLTPTTYDKRTSTTFRDSPETIFTQGDNIIMNDGSGIICPNMFAPSEELLNSYDAGDLRTQLCFYSDWSGEKFPVKLAYKENGLVSSSFLIRLPEVMLNKAEALAMLDRFGEARTLVDQLRSKRFKSADFNPITAGDGEPTVTYIRNERRRELCFESHRWFDLRRYAVNSKYPFTKEIVHDDMISNESTNWTPTYAGSYKLNKYGAEPAYVLPIPKHVLEYNKGNMKDNEVRVERQSFIK